MRIYRPIIFMLAAILLLSQQAFSQACATPYVTYTATTSCLTGYYSNGCQVSYMGHNYTAINGPHFNIPPTGNAQSATRWTDNGVCGSAVPTISTSGTLTAFSTTYGVVSASQNFNISGVNMTAGILVTPPTGFEVSLSSGGTYTATVTVGAAGTIASTPVYVRLKATATASTTLYNSKNIVLTSSGATTVNVSTTASSNTVNKAALTITASNQTVCYGTTVATVTAAGSYTPTGFVNGETASVITGSPSYTTTYTITTAAGTAGVTITPAINTLIATNYSFTFGVGTITVNAIPAAPTTTTPINYCQNATATQLSATGSNLLWYSSGGTTTTNFYTTVPTTVSGFTGNNYKWNFTVISTVTINSINIKGAGAGATNVQVTIFNASNASQGLTNTASISPNTVQTFTFAGGVALAPGNYYFSMNSGSGSANILVFTGTDITTDQSDGRLTYPNSNSGGNSGNKGPYYNVNYTYGSSSTSSTAPTPVTTTVGATTYNVTQTISGCESLKTPITVNVNANPSVSITGSNNICSGSTTTLSPTSGGTWVSNNTTVATVNSTSGAVSGAGAGTATFTFTASGCSATTLSVTVNGLPNAGSALAAVCQTGTTATLGGTAGSGSTSAIWSSSDGSGTFTSNTGSTPSTTTYIASATSPASVTLTLTQTGGACGTKTTSKTLTVNPSTPGITIWSGATNTDWATTTNWGCGGVPTNTTDVTIPTGLSNYPSINTTANTKNISIANGASLIIEGSNILNVYGDWNNNGTFTPNTSTVIFTGATSNAISGTAANTFYNFKMNKTATATLTVSGAVNLIEKLSFGTSAVNTLAINNGGGGSFAFKANPTTNAHIDILTAPLPVLSGNFTCEKYFPAQTGRYNFMLGVPVTTAPMSSLKATVFDGSGYPTNGFYITGSFTGSSTGTGLVTYVNSSFKYNPVSGLYEGYPISGGNITTAVTMGTGYRFSVRDGGSSVKNVVPKTISVTGPLANPGPYTFTNLTYNPTNKPFASVSAPTAGGGWNLIANPYMADINIDLSLTSWTKTNISTTTYIYNAKTRAFSACASGTPVSNCTVSAFQAFFVQATGTTPTLQINELAKISTSNNSSIKREEQKAVLNYLTIRLNSEITNSDDFTYIRYVQGATSNYDNFDGIKLGASERTYISDLGIYSKNKDGIFYDVNAKQYDFTSDTTDINIKSPIGNALLDFSDLSNLETGYTIALYDKFKKKIINVNSNPIYNFAITDDSNSTGPRFQVIFNNRSEIITNTADQVLKESDGMIIYPSPTTANNFNIITHGLNDEKGDIYIYDLLGRLVYTSPLKISNVKTSQSFDLSGTIGAGVYSVVVKSPINHFTQKVIIK